ncbi:hypothetical protein BKD89_07615 [Methanomethylophilus alvi]|uniref:Uncharacterized protein n=1 Tax=Methanomethylophilus alvi TaxID=1291540 RepID=A0A3G3IIJ3_9ARCH|nr:hypothetical protein BKD89_07615 [Methanomethylophilus alvi]
MSPAQVLENDRTVFRRVWFCKSLQPLQSGRNIIQLSDELFAVVQNAGGIDSFMYIDSNEFHGLLPSFDICN